MTRLVGLTDVIVVSSPWVMIDGEMFAACSHQLLAERIKQLLDRHGLVDWLDTTLGQPPVDWDRESYCTSGCGRPASHRVVYAFDGADAVYMLVCCECARHG